MIRSRRSYVAFRPMRSRNAARRPRNTQRASLAATPRGRITVRSDEANVATTTKAPTAKTAIRTAITRGDYAVRRIGDDRDDRHHNRAECTSGRAPARGDRHLAHDREPRRTPPDLARLVRLGRRDV